MEKDQQPRTETIFTQSLSPRIDQDALTVDGDSPLPRPMTSEELHNPKTAKEIPKRDMDTDLGA